MSIRALKKIHTATHPARLARSSSAMDGADESPAKVSDVLAALDDEATGEGA